MSRVNWYNRNNDNFLMTADRLMRHVVLAMRKESPVTIHIIPDWQDYARRLPEFNDSVHQAQLFLSQGQAVELIVIDFYHI